MRKLATLAILLGMTTVFTGCPSETKKPAEPPAAAPADAPADAPPADAPAGN